MLAVRATVDHFCVSKGLRRAGLHLGAELGKSGGNLRRDQAFVDRGIELADDALGRAGGRDHADIGQHDVIGHAALHHRRHVGEQRVAPFARDRERAQCAVAHQCKRAADVAEEHLHLPAQHAGDRIGGALVGDVLDIDAGPQLEQFGREVGGIAVPGRAVIELAGIRPGVGDKLRHRSRRECRMNDEHLIVLRDLGDRSEDFGWIVVAIVGHRRQHHQRADVSAQQAVAVGISARDRFRSQAAGGARTVLDHDDLSERAR